MQGLKVLMLFHLHLHTAHTNRRKNTGSAKIYCDAQSSHHLTFPPSLCHLSSNPYNQLNEKEISMSSFHATEDQVWHFNLEALAGHTQNNALVRKTNLSPCYKNKQPQWKLFFCVHPLLFESKVSFTGVYLNGLALQRETSIQCTIQ